MTSPEALNTVSRGARAAPGTSKKSRPGPTARIKRGSLPVPEMTNPAVSGDWGAMDPRAERLESLLPLPAGRRYISARASPDSFP